MRKGYLVEPIANSRTSLRECREMLEETYRYIVEHSRTALDAQIALAAPVPWGATLKRATVPLEGPDRPGLVGASEHNLIEVINQCANLERLVDALRWIESDASGLQEFSLVECCHPTTSSGSRENDIILRSPQGTRAFFEVSDVCGDKDSNRKENRELLRLGVLRRDKQPIPESLWPAGRLFLVVSSEFASLLRRSKRARYLEVKAEGSTHVFEICRG